MKDIALAFAVSALVAGVVLLVMRLIGSRGWSMPRLPGLSGVPRMAIKTLIAIGLWGLLSVLTNSQFPLPAWLVVMTVWFRAGIHWRAVQQRNLFGALALAIDKQMPLASMIRAFADERRGGFGNKARAMADQLDAGVELIDAIANSGGALPPEAMMVARVAGESGDLRSALEATSFGGNFDRTLIQTALSRLFYFWPVVLIFILFMAIKIGPSYVKIFDDFDMLLPPITVSMLQPTNTTLLISICYLLIAATFLVLFWGWCEWRGWINPRLPGLKPIIKWVDMGVVLRVLALSARRGCPLPQMLEALAVSHPKRWVRHRLQSVVTDIKDGCAWQKSLEIERLIGRADAAVLAAAQRSGNLGWALAEMADSFQRKATYRLQAVGQIAFPLLMLPVGILVCLLVVAYFAPLPRLIQVLS